MDDLAQSRLIAQARRGERAATARLLDALQDRWYRFAVGLLGSPDLARDATQETALRFLRQLAGYRGDSQLATWSLGIALNVVRELRRVRQPESWDDEGWMPATGTAAPDWQVLRRERTDALYDAVGHLPPRQREVIVLRFLEGLSVEETADLLGCAVGTVKATTHQAVRAIRQRLEVDA